MSDINGNQSPPPPADATFDELFAYGQALYSHVTDPRVRYVSAASFAYGWPVFAGGAA